MTRRVYEHIVLVLLIVLLGIAPALALVTCDEGCNNSVVAIRFQTLDPSNPDGYVSMCRVFDVATAAVLNRVVRVQGDAVEDDEPVVELTYWDCPDLKFCAAMCDNELTGFPGTSQRNRTEQEPDATCSEYQQNQRHCIDSSGS